MLMRHGWILALTLISLGTLVPISGALGVETTVRIPFDLDDDATTGCTVELLDPSSPTSFTSFEGAEATLRVGVDAFPDPPVTLSPQLTGCPPSSGETWVGDLMGGIQLEKNAGYEGSDSLLIRIPLTSLNTTAGTARIAVEASAPSGAHDLLLRLSDGTALIVDIPGAGPAVPALGVVGLLLLLGALIAAGTGLLSRRVLGVGALGIAFIVSSVEFKALASEGLGDWLPLFDQLSPLATDEAGDSHLGDPAADLRAVWVTEHNEELLVRVDVSEAEFRRCRGNDPAGNADCDESCDEIDDAASPDCNGVCDDQDSPNSWDCNGLCDAGEVLSDSDCDAACDARDSSSGPDCNGLCGLNDEASGPDCNGTCEADEAEGSADCPAGCDFVGDGGTYSSGEQWCYQGSRFTCQNGQITQKDCDYGCNVDEGIAYCRCAALTTNETGQTETGYFDAGSYWCNGYDRYYCPKVEGTQVGWNNPYEYKIQCPSGSACNYQVPNVPHQADGDAADDLCVANCYFSPTQAEYANGEGWCHGGDRYTCTGGEITYKECSDAGCYSDSGFAECK